MYKLVTVIRPAGFEPATFGLGILMAVHKSLW